MNDFEELQDRIKTLENKDEREALKAYIEKIEKQQKGYSEVFDLLHDIETCIRFVDKEKAFDTIMEIYGEAQEVYGVK